MIKTIEERMLSIEQELSEIRKEMEEEVGRYYTSYKTGFLTPPKKPTEPAIRRVVNQKVINFEECKP